jgi:hypothetical protein
MGTDNFFGQVTCAVGNQTDRASSQLHVRARCPFNRVMLRGHVFCFVRNQLAKRAQVVEHFSGQIGVDMHLEHITAANHDQRVAAPVQLFLHRSLRGQLFAAHHAFRAESVFFGCARIFDARGRGSRRVESRRRLQGHEGIAVHK